MPAQQYFFCFPKAAFIRLLPCDDSHHARLCVHLHGLHGPHGPHGPHGLHGLHGLYGLHGPTDVLALSDEVARLMRDYPQNNKMLKKIKNRYYQVRDDDLSDRGLDVDVTALSVSLPP